MLTSRKSYESISASLHFSPTLPQLRRLRWKGKDEMVRRLVVVDALLVVVLVLGAFALHDQWKAFELSHQISTIAPDTESFPKSDPPVGPAAGAATDWTDI